MSSERPEQVLGVSVAGATISACSMREPPSRARGLGACRGVTPIVTGCSAPWPCLSGPPRLLPPCENPRRPSCRSGPDGVGARAEPGSASRRRDARRRQPKGAWSRLRDESGIGTLLRAPIPPRAGGRSSGRPPLFGSRRLRVPLQAPEVDEHAALATDDPGVVAGWHMERVAGPELAFAAVVHP